ncbi:MAG: DUF1615 family protein [Proteobacteria bacterium]|nr:DUF1615 family protein [Pseudomonadota bacterium]
MILQTSSRRNNSPDTVRKALKWIESVKRDHPQLKSLYGLEYALQSEVDQKHERFIRLGSVLITPGMASMWDHCKRHFETQMPGWTVTISSGYRTPAYQLYLLSQVSGTLEEVLNRRIPPYFSRHYRKIPDITVRLTAPPLHADSRKAWDRLHRGCRKFGFARSYPGRSDFIGELTFLGIEQCYRPIFSNRLITEAIARDFYQAMRKTGFYPSPEGLRVLFALSAQESSIQWNPRLNKKKKRFLKNKFHNILNRIENSFGGAVSNLFLSEDVQKQKRHLIRNLERITNPANKKIREYDFYLWTRDAHRFLQNLLEKHRQITKLGEWMFELESIVNQLVYEPQTFGLWQININLLLERIESYPRLRRGFPELYRKVGGEWKVVRTWLIDALSGVPSSRLSRQRTMELIIRTYLQPRYRSHLQGEKDDLYYFIAENVAGEMSTFKAAVQQELNRILKTQLVLDGDLTFYFPYSTKIDWSKQSNSYKVLQRFIQKKYPYFQRPVDPQRLIRDLCIAETWDKLKESELYRRIMRKKRGSRIYPRIESDLYQQTPQGYSTRVMEKSLLFK